MIRRIAALAGLFALVAGAAAARPYPSEPVRFVVSYPAGGATAPAVLPQIQAGRLTAPAVTSARRQPGLPDVPTVAESGFPGFGCDAWFAVFAPAGTAEAIVARLNADIRAVLAEPEVIARLKDQGFEVATSTPDELRRHVTAEIAKWAAVVKASGAKPD